MMAFRSRTKENSAIVACQLAKNGSFRWREPRKYDRMDAVLSGPENKTDPTARPK